MFGDEQSFLRNFFRRGFYASPLLLISLGLFFKAINGGHPLFVFTLVCYSATFFLIGTIIIVPVFTGFFADSLAGALFTPHGNKPHFPAYSTAESMVKRGEFREAVDKLRDIAEEFPDDLRPWLEMIAIAVQHLHDDDAAFDYYREAREKFTSPDHRRRLLESYKALKSLTAEKPDWLQPRAIGLADQATAKTVAKKGNIDRQAPPPGENAQRRRIRYRTYDEDPASPPEGFLKATENSLPTHADAERNPDPPASSTRRAKLSFNPRETSANVTTRKRREEEEASSPAERPSETANARKKIPFNPPKADSR